MKKALVLSGGGAKGAWSGGVLEYLIKNENKQWDIVLGTSTGSLLSPLSSINEIDRLKKAYTTVNDNSIFNVKPFKDNGKLRLFNTLWRILTNKTSLGEAKNLRKKIEEVITEDDYNRIRNLKKDVIVVVTNITKNQVEYKSINNNSYSEFCDWMLTSSSVPILFEITEKNGDQYLDGGILETAPLQKAIDLGATEIDIILLKSNKQITYPKVKNIFDVAMRSIDLMNREISKDDVLIGQLNGKEMEVKINIYRANFSVKNTIIFNKKQMNEWWKMGYDYAKNHSDVKKMSMKRTKSNSKYKIIYDN